ncbi:MAG: hypothetical protein A3A86_02620 [Elusimicrobia bacterium RIFCSPLOWO2_01_FULL_60_11]|nr:MAG: hypothetical protein A3A86_02620 [Elusimicrobia bacterium RIFCSPLOWO2_01_FULL_60_11]
MKIDIAGRSDVGKKRANNEDGFAVDPEMGLFIVADGMGGHNHGEVASKMAVDTTLNSMKNFILKGQKAILGKVDPKVSERANQMASSVRLANQIIFESARTKPQYSGMGTTIDAVLIHKDRAAVAHVGDSRVYLARDGKLTQITEDHSLVEDQVRQGLLKREEADRSHLKNVLTRALGVDEVTEVDVVEVELRPGDLLIGCTDGLNKMVSDDEILKTVPLMKTPKMIADHLVDMANAAGGVDNVTVVVAQWSK